MDINPIPDLVQEMAALYSLIFSAYFTLIMFWEEQRFSFCTVYLSVQTGMISLKICRPSVCRFIIPSIKQKPYLIPLIMRYVLGFLVSLLRGAAGNSLRSSIV